MWLWKHENVTYINIKLSWTEGKNGNAPTDQPIFEIGKTGEYDGKFDGDLLAISLKPATEKYPFDQVSMRFIDDEFKLYSIAIGFNGALDNLVNCFIWGVASKSDFKKLSLSLYKQWDFAAIGVWKDGKQMQRGFDPVTTYNVLKKKVRINWKEATDREQLDILLKEKVLEINEYLKTLYDDENTHSMEEVDDNPFGEEEKGVGDKLKDKADANEDGNWLPF